MFYPRWVFELWAQGAGDIICANDYDLPISKSRRIFWRVRGHALHFLFGWWQFVRRKAICSNLKMDIAQGEGQISSRGVDSHVRECFGDTRGWEYYAQRTQRELSKLLRQPDLPGEAREKASDLFSWLGDMA